MSSRDELMACDVLGVFAHPDDESLLAGGLLAACAAAGMRVGILSMTCGELGVGAQDPDLAGVREQELREAGSALGAAWARCLDFPDGELHAVDRMRAAGALEDIPQHQLQAVLTFSAEGLYWHPDHIAVHEIVCSTFPTEHIYEVSWPQGLLAGVIEQLRRRGLADDVWGLDPDDFGVPADAIVRELDVSPFLGVKLHALRCHRSQLAGHAFAALPDELAAQLLGREWLLSCPDPGWVHEVMP